MESQYVIESNMSHVINKVGSEYYINKVTPETNPSRYPLKTAEEIEKIAKKLNNGKINFKKMPVTDFLKKLGGK